MFWFDWMALAIVLVVAITQTVRGAKAGGMGLPLFEAAGLVIAAVAATNLSGSISNALHMQKATVIIILFLVLGVGAFILGRWLFTVTQLTFESLDGLFSFLFGLVAGWTISHMVLRVVIESQGGSTAPILALMNNAYVAREVYQFRGWNWLMQLLFRARLSPEFNPDVG